MDESMIEQDREEEGGEDCPIALPIQCHLKKNFDLIFFSDLIYCTKC